MIGLNNFNLRIHYQCLEYVSKQLKGVLIMLNVKLCVRACIIVSTFVGVSAFAAQASQEFYDSANCPSATGASAL